MAIAVMAGSTAYVIATAFIAKRYIRKHKQEHHT